MTYLFDFDGTLVDSMPTFVSCMLRILDENDEKKICEINRMSLQSHVISFAAEHSRSLGGIQIEFSE